MAGLFGMPYEGDPTGALLGQNYNPQVEQEQKLWGLLEGAGQALLHPTRGSGDLGALANAFTGGAKQMGAAGSSYLATAYERKKAQDDLRRKQKEEDDQLALERDAVSWMKQFDPKTQEMINGNPTMAKDYWDAFLAERKAAAGASGSSNSLGAGQPLVMDDGSVKWFQPSLDPTGQPRVTPLEEGAQVGISPSLRRDQKYQSTEGGLSAEAYQKMPGTLKQTEMLIDQIDDVTSTPELEQYLGVNSVWSSIPGTGTMAVKDQMEQIAGGLRVQALQVWRGMGQFTQPEGESAVKAASAAAQAQRPSDFFYFMAKARYHIEAGRRLAQMQYAAGGKAIYVSTDELMKDYPKPKRSDFIDAGKTKIIEGASGTGAIPGSPSPALEEAKRLYPGIFD